MSSSIQEINAEIKTSEEKVYLNRSMLQNAKIRIALCDKVQSFADAFYKNNNLGEKLRITPLEVEDSRLSDSDVIARSNSINTTLWLLANGKDAKEMVKYMNMLNQTLGTFEMIRRVAEADIQHAEEMIADLEKALAEAKERKNKENEKTVLRYKEFDKSAAFDEEFAFCYLKSSEKDEYSSHSFACETPHILLANTNAGAKMVDNAYEDIFMRLFYKFDASLLDINPIGKFPIPLKALMNSCNRVITSAPPFKAPLMMEKDIAKFFAELDDEMMARAERYYFDENFFGYNRAHKDAPDKAIIIWIYNYPDNIPCMIMRCIEHLLLEKCSKYGIFIIANQLIDKETDNSLLDDSFGIKIFNVGENLITYDGATADFDLYDSNADRQALFLELEKEYHSEPPVPQNPVSGKESEDSVGKEEPHSAPAAEIISTVTEKPGVVPEIKKPVSISLEEMIAQDHDTTEYASKISFPIGMTTGGEPLNICFETKNEKCSMVIAGMTGSGKTDFLHTLILSACMKYSPKQLNVYLIDFKDGVGFAPYSTTLAIPHVKLISVRNSIADALMILEEIKAEKSRRNEIFKETGCSDIAQFNAKYPEKAIPRLFVVIDEYQVMLNDNSRMAGKCQDALDALSMEVRSAGISLILSSQTCACGNKVLSQAANRVCLKSRRTLAYMIDGMRDRDEEELNKEPIGSGYFSNGADIAKFRTYYTGDLSATDGSGKDKYAKVIRKKYFNDKIDFIISNDTRPLEFSDNVQNDIYSNALDFGVSVFNNAHLFLNFDKESAIFANVIMLGDKTKALEVEHSMLCAVPFKREKIKTYAFTFRSLKKPLLETAFMTQADRFSYNTEELISMVSELYTEFERRMSVRSRGEEEEYDIRVLFINSFNTTMLDNADGNSASVGGGFAWDAPKGSGAKEKLLKLYESSYQCGIYLVIHFDNDQEIKKLFDYSKRHEDLGFYLDKKAIEYFAERNYLSSPGAIELEERTSLFVRNGISYKFRRYTFS